MKHPCQAQFKFQLQFSSKLSFILTIISADPSLFSENSAKMIIVFVFKMDEQFKIARYIKFVVQPFRKVYGGWKCIKCSALVLNFCFGRGPSQANLLILQFLYLA